MLSNPIELVLDELVNHEQALEKLAIKHNSEDVSEMKKVQKSRNRDKRRLKRLDGSELSFP